MPNSKPFWDSEKLLDTIQKNKTAKIEVKLCERNDVKYVDIRVLKKASTSDDYLHTKEGICLSYELYDQITNLIDSNIE